MLKGLNLEQSHRLKVQTERRAALKKESTEREDIQGRIKGGMMEEKKTRKLR